MSRKTLLLCSLIGLTICCGVWIKLLPADSRPEEIDNSSPANSARKISAARTVAADPNTGSLANEKKPRDKSGEAARHAQPDISISRKPTSVLEGPESTLVGEARNVLMEPNESIRTTQWVALLQKADFTDLVRMTEIPAQPQLDDGRTALRSLTIQQLGQRHELGKLVAIRQQFDNEGKISSVQRMAWQEWAKTDPRESVTAWQKVQTEQLPSEGGNKIVSALAKGLAKAPADAVAAAIGNLTPEQREILTEVVASQSKPATGNSPSQ
jgi:hypothetical protein